MTIWNINNKEGLQKYTNLTTNLEMKTDWDSDESIDTKYKKWSKQVKSIMYQCFERISIKKKNKTSKVKEMIKVKKKIKKEIAYLNQQGIGTGIIASHMRTELAKIIDTIATEIQEERAEKIKKRMNRVLQSKTGKSNEIWKVRKNLTNKADPKMAVLDKEGKQITDEEAIKGRYAEYYQELVIPRTPEAEAVETIEQAQTEFEINRLIKKHDENQINQPFTEREN